MRAALYHGPGDLRVEDRPRPAVADQLDRLVPGRAAGAVDRLVPQGAGRPGTEGL